MSDTDSSSHPESYFQVVNTRTHVDHIYSYSGQNYGPYEVNILNALNELSQTKNLLLHRRQLSNRNTRITLPNRFSFYNDEKFKFKSSSSGSSSHRTESPYINMFDNLNENYTNLTSQCDDEDTDDYFIHDSRTAFRLRNERLFYQFENNNYQTFLYFFNKAAIACYLKVMKAPQNVRYYYSAGQDDPQTKFSVLNDNRDEKRLNHYIKDEEFITNYVNVMINQHMQIVHRLYKHLNADINFHLASTKPDQKESTRHLFRSFRIIGLRQKRKKSGNHNRNSNLYDFHRLFTDVVDIRSAFDIRQFQNRTGYDCFVECEFNYYKLADSSIISFNQKIANDSIS